MGNHQQLQPTASAPITVPTNVIKDIFRQNTLFLLECLFSYLINICKKEHENYQGIDFVDNDDGYEYKDDERYEGDEYEEYEGDEAAHLENFRVSFYQNHFIFNNVNVINKYILKEK